MNETRTRHRRSRDWRRYLRPSRRRLLGVLVGVLVAFSAFGISALISGARTDVIDAGDCQSATVVGGNLSRLPTDRFTVGTADGTRHALWGSGGGNLAAGRAVEVCWSSNGTWVDGMGDSSNWLLATQALVLPLVAGGLIVLASLFVGYEYPTPLRPQREPAIR